LSWARAAVELGLSGTPGLLPGDLDLHPQEERYPGLDDRRDRERLFGLPAR
jgi:hypothetical protein